MLLLCLFISFALLILQTSYRSPNVFSEYSRSSFISFSLWNHRFKILTVQLIVLPLVMFMILAMFIWPQWTVTRQMFDSIYLLKEYKEKRILSSVNRHYTSPEYEFLNSKFARVEINFDKIDFHKRVIEGAEEAEGAGVFQEMERKDLLR